ncbi:MAG: hypothetical protein WAQ08_12870 [Aquabacterium sp.]|uniref:hypothetical protein n=1 Tax=Aquabacterium sp. TaxID=1872578 RepID=UPI003BB0DF68
MADGLQGLPDLKGSGLENAAKRLTEALARATEQGQIQRQFAAAALALEALLREVEGLVEGAKGRGDALEASRQAQPSGTDPGAIAVSLENIRQLLATLKSHAGQAGAAKQIGEMDGLLKQAEKAATTEAPALLAQAGERYVQGTEHAAQHGQLLSRIDDVVQPAKALLDGSLPAISALVGKVDEQIDAALKLSLGQDHAQAAQRLDGALTLIGQARKLTDDIKACGTRFTALKDTTLPGLTTHTQPDADPVIGTEVKALGQALGRIDRLLKSRDYEAALTALDQAELNAQKASIKKKVSGGALTPEEMTEQCKQLVARPNGMAALDELVETFKSGQSVQAVLAAMKARFKLDDAECVQGTDDQGKVTQELCALYTSMTKVPDKHTRDNPSFKKIVRKPKGSGSSYNGGGKAIHMSEGHPDASAEREVAIVTELPDVEDDCKPAPGAKAVKFFDWNTWHEVGHAMDDRKRFMATHGSEAAYGGWIKHGADILAVAQAVAEELNQTDITARTIAAYLDAGTVPSPLPAQWTKVTQWATAAGSGQIPWKAGAKCNASVRNGGLQAKGRIYHEGYTGDWYSYLPAARKQGITGYQFRAPGEWFSELYAAYKSDKLKRSHPAKAWLDKLFAD